MLSEDNKFARSKDPVLLDFLSEVRVRQPDRARLLEFFQGRHLGFKEMPIKLRSILTKQSVVCLLVVSLVPGRQRRL